MPKRRGSAAVQQPSLVGKLLNHSIIFRKSTATPFPGRKGKTVSVDRAVGQHLENIAALGADVSALCSQLIEFRKAKVLGLSSEDVYRTPLGKNIIDWQPFVNRAMADGAIMFLVAPENHPKVENELKEIIKWAEARIRVDLGPRRVFREAARRAAIEGAPQRRHLKDMRAR